MSETYTKMLKESLGTVIYGIAQIHDEGVLDVFVEAYRILKEFDHPAELLWPPDPEPPEYRSSTNYEE